MPTDAGPCLCGDPYCPRCGTPEGDDRARWYVRLVGCDDETLIPLDVTPEEVAFLRRLGEASVAASEYRCQPRLYLLDSAPRDEDDDDA